MTVKTEDMDGKIIETLEAKIKDQEDRIVILVKENRRLKRQIREAVEGINVAGKWTDAARRILERIE